MTSRILNSNLRRMVVLTSSRTQFFGGTKVNITFVNRAQKEFQVKAREGDTVLDTVLDNMIEYDGEHDLNFMTWHFWPWTRVWSLWRRYCMLNMSRGSRKRSLWDNGSGIRWRMGYVRQCFRSYSYVSSKSGISERDRNESELSEVQINNLELQVEIRMLHNYQW